MDATRWLERNADGFAELTNEERSALMSFALIWSYFESEALRTEGSVAAIDAWIRELARQGRLKVDDFEPALAYMKARYFSSGQFTEQFYSLHLRPNNNPTLVEAVISGENLDPVDGVVVLFAIIYRFRNNYFHGPKWSYKMRGQLENLTLANEAIMAVIDMSRS